MTAFSDVGLIVLYADNATKRIGTHDLEETVFHESVHAAWDKTHAKSAEWQDAQKKDGGYVTDYARKNLQGEDLAESALFAYALLHHPNRIPKEEAARIARIIPNRITFVERLLPKDKPLHFLIEARFGLLPSRLRHRQKGESCYRDLKQAERLRAAKNEAAEKPLLGLALGKAYLSAYDPKLAERKRAQVMDEFCQRPNFTCLAVVRFSKQTPAD